MGSYLLVLLFFTSVIGSAINAIAGGGSFFTFPVLIFCGIPIISANATSKVALWPGSVASSVAYKNHLEISRNRLIVFCVVSIVGCAFGTWLLLITPSEILKKVVPFLLLIATIILMFKNRISQNGLLKRTTSPLYIIIPFQFIIAVYGGYFGGGIGILMLATFSLMGFKNMLQMNALKTLMTAIINGSAVILFIFTDLVVWDIALMMIVGGIMGGILGAYIGKIISQRTLNRFVILTGIVLTFCFFIKY